MYPTILLQKLQHQYWKSKSVTLADGSTIDYYQCRNCDKRKRKNKGLINMQVSLDIYESVDRQATTKLRIMLIQNSQFGRDMMIIPFEIFLVIRNWYTYDENTWGKPGVKGNDMALLFLKKPIRFIQQFVMAKKPLKADAKCYIRAWQRPSFSKGKLNRTAVIIRKFRKLKETGGTLSAEILHPKTTIFEAVMATPLICEIGGQGVVQGMITGHKHWKKTCKTKPSKNCTPLVSWSNLHEIVLACCILHYLINTDNIVEQSEFGIPKKEENQHDENDEEGFVGNRNVT
uniref:Uncharacterized protein n=1 Tax=Romanomermis culicivorax TaxID=13658 RepID=A0A915HSI1_ROMCU